MIWPKALWGSPDGSVSSTAVIVAKNDSRLFFNENPSLGRRLKVEDFSLMKGETILSSISCGLCQYMQGYDFVPNELIEFYLILLKITNKNIYHRLL